MSKFKVGDRVKIVGNSARHGFSIGDVVKVYSCQYDDYYLASTEQGEEWFFCGEDAILEPPQNQIIAGKTYKSKDGSNWFCIYTKGDKAWMTRDYGEGPHYAAAYVFNVDGTPVSFCEEDYIIILAPKVEWKEDWVTFYDGDIDRELKLSIKYTDGVPDWETAKVTPFKG